MTMVGVMRMGFNELNCCGGEQRLRFCDVCGCCVGGQGAGVRLTRIGRQENRPQSCIPPSSTSKGSFHCPASSSVVQRRPNFANFASFHLLVLVVACADGDADEEDLRRRIIGPFDGRRCQGLLWTIRTGKKETSFIFLMTTVLLSLASYPSSLISKSCPVI